MANPRVWKWTNEIQDHSSRSKAKKESADPVCGQWYCLKVNQWNSGSEFRIKGTKWNYWSSIWPIIWLDKEPIKLQYSSIKGQFWRHSFRMLQTSHLSRLAARCLHSQGKAPVQLLAEKRLYNKKRKKKEN